MTGNKPKSHSNNTVRRALGKKKRVMGELLGSDRGTRICPTKVVPCKDQKEGNSCSKPSKKKEQKCLGLRCLKGHKSRGINKGQVTKAL